MYQTIQLSSRVSVQGNLIERLPNGEVLIRAGGRIYRGRPIAPADPPHGIRLQPQLRSVASASPSTACRG